MSALRGVVSVRFDSETETRLDRVSERFGVKSAMLIRNAVREYLAAIESGDTLVLHAVPPAEPAARFTHNAKVEKSSLNQDSPPFSTKKKRE